MTPCKQTIWSRIAKARGIKPATFHNRVRRGWPPCRAALTDPRPYFYEWNPT